MYYSRDLVPTPCNYLPLVTCSATHHVFWLEVSVRDLVPVQLAERQHHGGRVEARLLLRQLARGLQEVEELAAGQQLQHEVAVIKCL